MRYLTILLILGACHPLIADPIKVTYAADLTAGCSPVESIQPGSTKNDLVDRYIDLKADYTDICQRHSSLAKAINGQ